MTDRVTPIAPQPSRNPPVCLTSQGKLWARLHVEQDGRYLEVAERGVVVVFDLEESARQGRAVVVGWESA